MFPPEEGSDTHTGTVQDVCAFTPPPPKQNKTQKTIQNPDLPLLLFALMRVHSTEPKQRQNNTQETLPAEYVPRTGVGRLKPGLGKGKGKVGGKGKGKGGGKGGGKGKGSGKGKGGEGAGKVNGGAGKADTHPKKGRMMTQSSRAGLIFPVGRVHRMIKANVFKGRVSGSAAVYVAAFMEYICKEVLEGAANKAKV